MTPCAMKYDPFVTIPSWDSPDIEDTTHGLQKVAKRENWRIN